MIAFTPPSRTYAGYLFDCDGTLVDTMPLYYEAWKAAIHSFAPAINFTVPLFYSMAGMSVADTVANLNRLFDARLDVDAVNAAKHAAMEVKLLNVRGIEPVLAFARECLALGRPTAVVSGSPRAEVERSLQAIGLLDAIPHRVCQGEAPRGKPAPDPFLKAAALLGVDPGQCLVLEDSDLGIQAAIDAGMDWIKIPNTLLG